MNLFAAHRQAGNHASLPLPLGCKGAASNTAHPGGSGSSVCTYRYDPPRQGIVVCIGQQCLDDLPVVALLPTWAALKPVCYRKRTFHLLVEIARKRWKTSPFLGPGSLSLSLSHSPLDMRLRVGLLVLVLMLMRFVCPSPSRQCSHLMLLEQTGPACVYV